MQQYYPTLLQIILQKLEKSNSDIFKMRFTRLYHLVSAKIDEGLGADFFMGLLDSIQDGLAPEIVFVRLNSSAYKLHRIFVPIYLKIILPTTPTLARPLDRKIAVISLTKTLTKSRAFAERYAKGWGYTCNRLLELLINPPVIANAGTNIADDHDVDDMSFGVGFTELVTIRRPPMDYFPGVQVGKEWVGQELNAANTQSNGQIANFVQTRLEESSQDALKNYMQ